MALSTTNISTELVRRTLASSNNSIGALCNDELVNKWSRYKPVSGTPPAGTSNKFGLNLPTSWNRSLLTSNIRIGDFALYEHNKANTDPPVYADYTTVTGNFMPSTKDENVIPKEGTWRYGKNTSHANVRILPSDIGVDSYYWGVKLTTPNGFDSYYKTLDNLNDNETFIFDLKFTDPGSLIFTNWPTDATPGTWSWQLFISSEQASSWTESTPANIINLPTDAGIARLITSGTLNLLPYIVFGIGSYTPITALPSAGGNFVYTAGSKTSGYDYGVVNTNSESAFTVNVGTNTWVNYAVYNTTNSIQINDPAGWLDGCCLRIWCDQNADAPRSPEIYVETEEGGQYGFTVNQAGPPLSFNHNPAWSEPCYSVGPTATANYTETQIYITGTPSNFYSGSGTRTMYVWVTKSGVWVGNVLSFGAKDGMAYTQYITGMPPLEYATYNIYYDSVDRHLE